VAASIDWYVKVFGFVPNLDELFERVQAMGVKVLEPPSNRSHGHRDFLVADLDDNVVWVTVPLPMPPRS
jgi:hypothetical protein